MSIYLLISGTNVTISFAYVAYILKEKMHCNAMQL